jgi:hypothetical protein
MCLERRQKTGKCKLHPALELFAPALTLINSASLAQVKIRPKCELTKRIEKKISSSVDIPSIKYAKPNTCVQNATF